MIHKQINLNFLRIDKDSNNVIVAWTSQKSFQTKISTQRSQAQLSIQHSSKHQLTPIQLKLREETITGKKRVIRRKTLINRIFLIKGLG
jgi:hypothetical protein